MINLKITAVEQGPQDDEPFSGQQGTIYPQAWLCQVETEDGIQEQAKITLGAKSRSGSPSAKYIEAGSMVASKKRTEHNGIAQYYVDQNATKALHGDEYQGEQRTQSRTTPTSSVGQDDRNRSFALSYAKDLAMALLPSLGAGDSMLEEIEAFQFHMANKNLEWLNGVESVTEPTTDLDTLVSLLKEKEIYEQVKQAGFTKDSLMKVYIEEGMNKEKFLNRIGSELTGGNSDDNLPF